MADEGGWWPDFASNADALETLTAAIEDAGERPGERVVISLDVAASEFAVEGGYRLTLEDRTLTREAMIETLGGWIEAYPIASVEDPLSEDDAEGMAAFTAAHGGEVQVVADDFVVTDAGLIEGAARAGAANAALIKVNQAGTVTRALEALVAAEAAGWRCVVSARSGESEDVSIVHLAVGLGSGQLKVGSIARSERCAKWNEALRIEEALGATAFAGPAPLAGTRWGRASSGS